MFTPTRPCPTKPVNDPNPNHLRMQIVGFLNSIVLFHASRGILKYICPHHPHELQTFAVQPFNFDELGSIGWVQTLPLVSALTRH